MASPAAPALRMSFDQQFAQVQASITERKAKDPVFNSLMEENAETVDALRKSIENIFKKIKATPFTTAFAKKFFQCSYAAALVVPPGVDKKRIFNYDAAVLDGKEPLSDEALDHVETVVCKRIQFFVNGFFARTNNSTIEKFLKAIGPSAEDVLYQFSQVEDVDGRQKCYYLVDYTG